MRGNQKNKDFKFEWTPEMAYAIGLLTTDGNLSKDGRHIDLTSKDIQLLQTFKRCLHIDTRICYKKGGLTGKKYPRIQFSNAKFYRELIKIGLMPNKSKVLGEIDVPDNIFIDFLRGHFDGDGCCYSFWDKRWPNSFMFYTRFISASPDHITWLQKKIRYLIKITGSIQKGAGVLYLEFAKSESKLLWEKIYYKKNIPCLLRKRRKIENILKIQAQVVERFTRTVEGRGS